jgi:hypothetical protein
MRGNALEWDVRRMLFMIILKSKNDLRFVRGTFSGQISARYKDALVTWANALKKRYMILGGDCL